jgi:hypothetical protein
LEDFFPSLVFSSLQVEEFNDKQKEVEAVCNPIITKMYQSAGGDPGNQRRLSPIGFTYPEVEVTNLALTSVRWLFTNEDFSRILDLLVPS